MNHVFFTHRIKNENGNTLVELIMVMMLLVLFGSTIFTLIYTGADTEKRIISHRDSQSDARIALSYINVRLRQNDMEDKISVEKTELTGEDAILIKERGYESNYDTWIYWINGQLLECLTDPGSQPQEIDSYEIVSVEGFETNYDPENGIITNKIIYNYGDKLEELASTVYLRSFRRPE